MSVHPWITKNSNVSMPIVEERREPIQPTEKDLKKAIGKVMKKRLQEVRLH